MTTCCVILTFIRNERRCDTTRIADASSKYNVKTLSAMDVLAPISMKNAAKCDTSCELQNQWVIKTLNAPCASLGEHVCWSVCSYPPYQNTPTAIDFVRKGGCAVSRLSRKRWTNSDERYKIETNPSYPLTFRSSSELFDQEGRDVESVYSDYESRPLYFFGKSCVANVAWCEFRGYIQSISDLQSGKNTRWI